MNQRGLGLWAAVLAASLLAGGLQAEDWTGWRGPRDDGTSTETGLPTRWSRTENVRWKVRLPGPGNSTPLVLKDRVFLTQATEGGRRRSMICLERKTGQEIWRQSIEHAAPEPTHKGNPYCSASPVTDGRAVYAWHGSAGVVAYDLEGKELWRRDLGQFTHIWGNAGSPVVFDNLLILNCGPGERAFVTALNTATGEVVWEVSGISGKADQFLGSWSSPRLVHHAGKDLVLISRPHALVALEPYSGREVWSCEGLTDLVYTTPLAGDGVAVAMSGYTGKALAVRLGGTGNVTAEHRLWVTPDGVKNPQRIGSGIVREGRIYLVNEPGLAECIDLKSGESLWKDRLCGTTWSSPVWADGRFYLLDQGGTTYVFTAGDKLELVAKNELGEHCNSSHAVSQGNLFIRTYDHLWCLGPGD